jgi:hypothetical protein
MLALKERISKVELMQRKKKGLLPKDDGRVELELLTCSS